MSPDGCCFRTAREIEKDKQRVKMTGPFAKWLRGLFLFVSKPSSDLLKRSFPAVSQADLPFSAGKPLDGDRERAGAQAEGDITCSRGMRVYLQGPCTAWRTRHHCQDLRSGFVQMAKEGAKQNRKCKKGMFRGKENPERPWYNETNANCPVPVCADAGDRETYSAKQRRMPL